MDEVTRVIRQEKVLDEYLRDRISREVALDRLTRLGMDSPFAQDELDAIDKIMVIPPLDSTHSVV